MCVCVGGGGGGGGGDTLTEMSEFLRKQTYTELLFTFLLKVRHP